MSEHNCRVRTFAFRDEKLTIYLCAWWGCGWFASGLQSPDFELDNKETQPGSFVDFPSQNVAFFAENSFRFSEKFSVTPGLRFEHIETSADGLIQQVDPNDEHNILISEAKKQSNRQVFLYGLGLAYTPNENREYYANFSKNYRAINFNDLYTINPNIVIDSNLTDESGYTIDLGWRGTFKNIIQFDTRNESNG